MSIYDTLNTEQAEAVRHTEGPVLILAGAGSGKTRVITHRIAYLMDECGVNPWNILAITFTNKAAGEMRERVDNLIGFGAESVWISTFHSMCVRILRRHIDLMGYDSSFTIYDTDDQKSLMKDVCKYLKIDTKDLKERAILSEISSAKNELITPLQYREENVGVSFRNKRIADAYEEYQKRLKKNNALDFDDLLMLTVELFHSHDEVLANYQNRFRYIMVDEYQDTNNAQFELVRLLADRNRNLCVVGDDDQSIYRFRGANIRNILDFEKVYPDALVVKLEQNYRSTQTVLDAANAVIGNNVKRKKKALWTDRGEGTKLHLKQFNTAREEAAFITDDIARKMRADRHLHYSDFAILYRTNAQARSLEERFVLDSIPYNVVGGTNFYDRREIRDMIAYLKTIDNGQDEIAVRRILNVPRRGIGATTMARLSDYAVDRDVTFFAAMESCRNITSLGRSTAKIESFVKLILSLREFAQEHRLSELLRQIIIQTEYEAYLRDLDDEDGEDRISNVDELVSKITDYEETAEEPTLSGFLEEVALVSDLDNTNESQDKVLLMTLHSAKGLEFPHVYITGMEDGIFPSAMALNSDDEEAEEEERRLAYVGITRAKDDLTLTCSRTRMLRGEVQYNPMSRFVAEIPEELFDSEVPSNRYEDDHPFDRDYSDRGDRHGSSYGGSTYGSISSYGGSAYSGSAYAGSKAQDNGRTARPRLKAVYKKPSTDDAKKPYIAKAGGKGLSSLSKGMPSAPSAPNYGPGDRVRHTKYGEGTVKAVEAGPRDYKVTVQFDEYGQKIMYAAFAKLVRC
jgi:DNA helicase-2/ATP-dependent DNA helicase PcrA